MLNLLQTADICISSALNRPVHVADTACVCMTSYECYISYRLMYVLHTTLREFSNFNTRVGPLHAENVLLKFLTKQNTPTQPPKPQMLVWVIVTGMSGDPDIRTGDHFLSPLHTVLTKGKCNEFQQINNLNKNLKNLDCKGFQWIVTYRSLDRQKKSSPLVQVSPPLLHFVCA